MIIGNGMIANAFLSTRKEDDKNIIFASGVSNSNETIISNFNREEDLLRKTLSGLLYERLVYFSTCSIYDSSMANSLYVQHKMNMERIIRENSSNYIIIRLPQVVGKTNSPTIINYLYNAILSNEKIMVFSKSKRNLIDVELVAKITNHIIDNNILQCSTINIASDLYPSILEIISVLEKLMDKEAKLELLDRGNSYFIDIEPIRNILKSENIIFNDNYVFELIKKYYG